MQANRQGLYAAVLISNVRPSPTDKRLVLTPTDIHTHTCIHTHTLDPYNPTGNLSASPSTQGFITRQNVFHIPPAEVTVQHHWPCIVLQLTAASFVCAALYTLKQYFIP